MRISKKASPKASPPIGDAIKCAEADFTLLGTMQREAAMREHAKKVLEAREKPQRNVMKVLYCVKCEKPSELGVPQLIGQVWYAHCAKCGAKYTSR